MSYLSSRGDGRSRRPTLAQLRRAYRVSAADARAHGERPISFAAYRKLVNLQARLAARDPGGNIVL